MLHMLSRWLLVAAILGVSTLQANADGDERAETEGQEEPRLCFGGGGEGTENAEAAELSLESGLNASGHWLAKVRLQHMAGRPGGQSRQAPLQLQMRRSTRRSGGNRDARLVTLQATLTGAPSHDQLPWRVVDAPCSACPTSEPEHKPCPSAEPCPTCPSPLPSVPPPTCPSPCPPPCPSPTPCPTCQVPLPIKCPSPCPSCPAPQQCPSPCPSCPSCPAPPKCPSPCPSCPSCPALPKCPSPCPACPACPKPTAPGYERHQGHGEYRLHLLPLNWYEAQATCEREGAHLAVINSQAEADILARILKSQPISVNYVLMGFHDLYSEGAYYTVLDKPLHLSGYHKWGRGEPNNDGNEDCGGMYVNDMGYNDHKCHHLTAPFICEML